MSQTFNSLDSSRTELLFTACINSNIDEMKLLIEQGVNPKSYWNLVEQYHSNDDQLDASKSVVVTTKTDPNNTLLHAAILSNNIQTIEYVINDLGINDLDEKDLYGYNSILIAMKKGYLNIVKYLIEKYQIKLQYNTKTMNEHFITIAFESKSPELLEYIANAIEFDLQTQINVQHIMSIISSGSVLMLKYIIDTYKINVAAFLNQPDEIDDSGMIVSLYDWVIQTQLHNIELLDYLIIHCEFNCDKYFRDNNSQTPLVRAANRSLWDTFYFLIQQHNVQAHNNNPRNQYERGHIRGPTILHHVMNKHVTTDIIDYCINELGCMVESAYDRGKGLTPVYYAGCVGNYTIMKYLIEKYNAKVDIGDDEDTLLHTILVEPGCPLHIIQYLLQSEDIVAKINELAPSTDQHILQTASETASLSIIKCLIENNAQIPPPTEGEEWNDDSNEDDESDRYVILRNAARNRDHNVLDYLLQQKQFQTLTPDGNILIRLLYDSIYSHDCTIAKLLVEKYHVDPTDLPSGGDIFSSTLWTTIIKASNYKLFQYLLSLECFKDIIKSFTIENLIKSTLLHEVITTFTNTRSSSTDLLHFLEILSQYNIKFDMFTDNVGGRTPIQQLLLWDHPSTLPVLDYLISKGMNINQQDCIGRTALHLISNDKSRTHQLRIFRHIIVNYNVDINIQTDVGASILHILIRNDDCRLGSYIMECIRVLFKYNPNVHLRDEFNNTPLLWQCAEKHSMHTLHKLLLQHNADVFTTNNSKQTIFHLLAGGVPAGKIKYPIMQFGIGNDLWRRLNTEDHDDVRGTNLEFVMENVITIICDDSNQ